MALIACRECQHEISDQAAACPHCGAPLQAASPKEVKARSGVADGVKIGCGIFIVLPLLILMLLALLGGFLHGFQHYPR